MSKVRLEGKSWAHRERESLHKKVYRGTEIQICQVKRGRPVKIWNMVKSERWKLPKYSGARTLKTLVATIAYTAEMIKS